VSGEAPRPRPHLWPRPHLRRRARLWQRPSWMDEGSDPDYRWSLANERTFLAWFRTALALIAAAVAVVQLVPTFTVPGGRTVLGAALAAAGAGLPVFAYRRWAAVEQAMRRRQSLPYTVALVLAAAVLAAVGLIVLVLVLAAHR
jgi:putative membrane protein